MDSKERVLTTFAGEKADRVPINYAANPGIDARLREHFGVGSGDGEGLMDVFGVDFRGVGAWYTGPRLHKDIPERKISVTDWGIHSQYIEHESGGYWECVDFPLSDATAEEIAVWPMPSPDDHDYSHVAESCASYRQYAINGSEVRA